jgi:hypothetical protein
MNQMSWLTKIFIVLFSFIVMPFAYSKAFDSLYEVIVQVNDNSDFEERRYITEATNTLLLRLTGQEDFSLRYTSQIMNNIDDFILQKGFISRNEYSLVFIEQEIRTFMRNNDLNYWGIDRPVVGITTFDASLFNNPTYENTTDYLAKETNRRAIFIDLVDIEKYGMSSDDYMITGTGNFPSDLRQDGYNYLVIVDFIETRHGQELGWVLVSPDDSEVRFSGTSMEEGFSFVGGYLASRYGLIDVESSIAIVVELTNDTESFLRLRNYLSSLGIINFIGLDKIVQNKFYFTLDVVGGLGAFESIIALDGIIYNTDNFNYVLTN